MHAAVRGGAPRTAEADVAHLHTRRLLTFRNGNITVSDMETDAAQGLAHVAAARAALADRLVTPWWYLPTFGAALATSALGLGVGLPEGLPLCFAGLAGALALPFIQVHTSGVSYTGSVRGRHDLWLWALLVTAVVLHGAALLVGLSAAPARVAWVPAALLVPATIALGRGYERELGATLRGNR